MKIPAKPNNRNEKKKGLVMKKLKNDLKHEEEFFLPMDLTFMIG